MNKDINGTVNTLTSTDIVDRRWIDINIPCRAACPIMTDIPGYIQAIMDGDYDRAYMINRMDNVLPGVLGRICHRPCEGVCRHGRDGLGDPVSICFLKRSASDFGLHNPEPQIIPNGKKVCIIGSGPSGLTAANDLAMRGYTIIVLEQFSEPGGMLRYGIPRYRLPLDILDKDIQSILGLGVTLKTSVRIEEMSDLETLRGEYDAVIIAGGCMLPKKIDLPNMDADGFFWGLEFMMDANLDRLSTPMKNVVVVGGGFTSVDCCRMAYRYGAKNITMTFLFTKADLTIGEHEIDAMEAEGIEFEWLVAPKFIEEKDGKVKAITMVRNALDKDHKVVPIEGSEFDIIADTLVLAIGQNAEELAAASDAGNAANVFLAGDFRNGASTVIEAAADGRRIAREVHKFLAGIEGYQDVVYIKPVKQTGRSRDYDFIERQPMDEIPVAERSEKNREVETGFSKDKSLVESRRCYLCHYNFQIDIDRCIYCLKCIDVMPVHCIKMVKDIEINDDGSLVYVETKLWSETQAIAIDNDACIRCGNCLKACPVECITLSKYELDVMEKK